MNASLAHRVLTELSLTARNQEQSTSWNTFSDRDWGLAMQWMDLGGLAVYFRNRIEETGSVQTLPNAVRNQLDKRASANRIRSSAIAAEIRSLTEGLRYAGARYAVLKGVGLIPEYCPDLALRTQYDHDILIEPRHLPLVETALQQAGLRRKKVTTETVVYIGETPNVRFADNSEGLYSHLLNRSIELHLTLWEEGEDLIRINMPNDFLDRARVRQLGDFEFTALSDEDCLLFQVLHAFRHILRNWCRLSIFLEIARFMNQRQSDTEFWYRFMNRIENLRCAPEATLIVFRLAQELFKAPSLPQVESCFRTRLYPALSLWIETYGKRSAMANFGEDKCSTLFLHREFLETADAWKAIRRKRLVPLRRPHKPPPIVFQRGFSQAGRRFIESVHALRRMKFHAVAGLRYIVEYPRWLTRRRARLAST
jgi:hypothetical protein